MMLFVGRFGDRERTYLKNETQCAPHQMESATVIGYDRRTSFHGVTRTKTADLRGKCETRLALDLVLLFVFRHGSGRVLI
jgi:hypothetical protein